MKKKNYKDLYYDLLKKYNSLESKHIVLENYLKNDSFYQLINLLNQKDTIKILKDENIAFREKNKELKKELFEINLRKNRRKSCLEKEN